MDRNTHIGVLLLWGGGIVISIPLRLSQAISDGFRYLAAAWLPLSMLVRIYQVNFAPETLPPNQMTLLRSLSLSPALRVFVEACMFLGSCGVGFFIIKGFDKFMSLFRPTVKADPFKVRLPK